MAITTKELEMSYKLLVTEYYRTGSSDGGTAVHQIMIEFETRAEADWVSTQLLHCDKIPNASTRVVKLYEQE